MPIRWLLIFWMFAISAISYLDRVNISIAAAFMQREFHIDDLQLGTVFSAFLVGYALFQAPAGRLADRFGPRLILALGTFWWGVFTALTALVSARMAGLFLVLLAVRFTLGAGEAVLFPASNRFVANWIPSQERGLANGIIFAGVGFGAGITPPLVTFIVLHYGWRASFWVSAVIGLAAGAVWYWLARDRPEEHPWVTAAETALIEAGLPEPPAELEIGKPLPWRVILGSKDVLAMAFSYFTYGYAAWIFFAWFFKYLSEVRGLDLKSSSYYAMLPFIAMAVGSVVGGRVSDLSDAALWQSHRPLRRGGGGHCTGGHIHRVRHAGGERAAGERGAGGRRRRFVPLAKLVLVGHRRHGRRIRRVRFRRHEYGRPDRRHRDRLPDSVDRPSHSVGRRRSWWPPRYARPGPWRGLLVDPNVELRHHAPPSG